MPGLVRACQCVGAALLAEGYEANPLPDGRVSARPRPPNRLPGTGGCMRPNRPDRTPFGPAQIHDAFAAAWAAIDEVERRPGMTRRAFVEARRHAAEAALKRSLGALGLSVQVRASAVGFAARASAGALRADHTRSRRGGLRDRGAGELPPTPLDPRQHAKHKQHAPTPACRRGCRFRCLSCPRKRSSGRRGPQQQTWQASRRRSRCPERCGLRPRRCARASPPEAPRRSRVKANGSV